MVEEANILTKEGKNLARNVAELINGIIIIITCSNLLRSCRRDYGCHASVGNLAELPILLRGDPLRCLLRRLVLVTRCVYPSSPSVVLECPVSHLEFFRVPLGVLPGSVPP